MSSSCTQVEQQQNVAPPALDAGGAAANTTGGEPQDVGAVVLKAKKAAASLWMILHAQVSFLRGAWIISFWRCFSTHVALQASWFNVSHRHISHISSFSIPRAAALVLIDVHIEAVPIPSDCFCTSRPARWRRAEDMAVP